MTRRLTPANSLHATAYYCEYNERYGLISKAQHNFYNEVFDSVEALPNSAIAERHFDTKSRRNLTSPIKITRHYPNTYYIFAILDGKRVSNLRKKVNIYENYDRNEIKLSSKFRIALLTGGKMEVQQILQTLVCNPTFAIAGLRFAHLWIKLR